MKIYLCYGDVELLRDIASRKVDDDANLNDSQRRSARYLYNQELITAVPLEGSDADVKVLEITPEGRARLAQEPEMKQFQKPKYVPGKDDPNKPRGWCTHYVKGYCNFNPRTLEPGKSRCIGSYACEEYNKETR